MNIKKAAIFLVGLIMLSACTGNQGTSAEPETARPIDSEVIEETENSEMSIREIKNGTKINMHLGDTIIPGILNDSAPAQELISRLPYTIHASRYDFDICGVMAEPLTYSDDDLVKGWKNGDIDFTVAGDYFTILFDNEENAYGEFVNLGVIDCDPSMVDALHGGFDILIELAP